MADSVQRESDSERATTPPVEALTYAVPATPTAEEHSVGLGMTRGDVAALAIRIIGFYVAVQGLLFLSFVFQHGFRNSPTAALSLVFLALYEGFAAFLLVLAPRIGRWLLPRSPVQSHDFAGVGWHLELQAVAFSVVGLVLIVSSAPTLIVILWSTIDRTMSIYRNTGGDLIGSLLHPGTEFILGLLLFFGAKRLSLYWRGTRAARSAIDDESAPL
jgi:hypothetical protein